MWPHFVLLYGVSLIALIFQQRRFTQGVNLSSLLLIVLTLSLFGGWRGDHVGIDTNGYIERFEHLVSLKSIWDFEGSSELGYKILLALSLLLSDNPTIFLVLTSGFASITYITAIYRLAYVPALAIFVFISYGFYAFHMNGLRQGIALGVFMHAIPSLLTGRTLRYVLWALAASMFHSSAVLVIVAYPLFRLGFSLWSMAIIVVSSALMVVGSDIMLGFAGLANERYVLYGQRTETGGAMLTLFHVLAATIFVLGRPFVKNYWRPEYDRLLIVFLFGTTIYVLVFLTGSYVEMNRIALYFTVTMTFLWPLLIRSFIDIKVRLPLLIGLIFSSSLFYLLFLSQIGGYTPYTTR